jgi:hypothetical protein
MCIGGPPCVDNPVGGSSANKKSPSASKIGSDSNRGGSSPRQTSVVELARTVVSHEAVRISIQMDTNRILIYQQSILPGNLPTLFTYELMAEDIETLKMGVGKTITIFTESLNPETKETRKLSIKYKLTH